MSRRWQHEGRVRDDDTSYFTEPGRLEAVYHDVWDRIPVGLAVIPQAAGFADKAIPEQYSDAGPRLAPQ